jgi:endonuclease YncB( thermonuclease family)
MVVSFIICISIVANAVIAGPVPAKVLRVVDGDTLEVEALIWIGQSLTVKVRLAGIDAPEAFRPGCATERALGRAAADFVTARLSAGAEVALRDIEPDKYGGRVVARVEADGADIGAALIAEGLAAPIDERSDWCA